MKLCPQKGGREVEGRGGTGRKEDGEGIQGGKREDKERYRQLGREGMQGGVQGKGEKRRREEFREWDMGRKQGERKEGT